MLDAQGKIEEQLSNLMQEALQLGIPTHSIVGLLEVAKYALLNYVNDLNDPEQRIKQ